MKPVYITLDDQEWLFDESTWTLKDYFVIKAESGLNRIAFLEGDLEHEDPTALQTLVWYLRYRAGDKVARASIDFAPAALSFRPVNPDDVDEDDETGDGEGDHPPVDVATTTTSGPDATSTSTSSRTGARSARQKSTS